MVSFFIPTHKRCFTCEEGGRGIKKRDEKETTRDETRREKKRKEKKRKEKRREEKRREERTKMSAKVLIKLDDLLLLLLL